MESKITNEYVDQIISSTEVFYDRKLTQMYNLSKKKNTAGMIRQMKGDLVEDVVHHIWDSVLKLYKGEDINAKIISGKEDKKLLISKSKRGEYYHSQDLHFYLNKSFILSIETKSYTESAMYKRVCEDARLLKKYVNPKLVCILVELECARDPKSQIFMDEEYGTIHKIFTLVQGGRSSTKPIHKNEFRKNLDSNALRGMIVFFDNFLISETNNL